MTVWAIVPVKPLRRGKSRLSAILDKESRIALNHCLLENTLFVLTEVQEIEQVLVISRDPQALAIARSFRARTIQEAGTPHLNHALERATLFARRHAVRGVMIVPADLPLINTLDIQKLLHLASKPPSVVISPDRHRKGTNALFISPPGIIKYQFGEKSFHLHCQQAITSGAHLEIADLPSLSLDLDMPEDLQLVRREIDLLNFEVQKQFEEPKIKQILSNKLDVVTYQPSESCVGKIIELEIGGQNDE
jgi:2-phospho-L-lactate/phosphoenolpyruvate guanylyltransferase